MALISGVSRGVVTAWAIVDMKTGKQYDIEELVSGDGSDTGPVTVDNITDATDTGKQVLKAESKTALKDLIGVEDGAEGPQGPKGDTGADGAKGAKGDKGATGDTGEAGPAGLGISSIAASRSDDTVTLTFTMTDTTTQTASFDLPTA